MLREILDILSSWSELDTWIVVTAALAAMACALPGNFLLVRRQSMMGDALSHTTLPGVVIAFLLAHQLETLGWISEETFQAWRHGVMLAGAMAIGVFSAVLTEWVQRLGRVENAASLGVVFTTLFALGLLLIRVAADRVHLDPDCVLYGTVETVVMDPWGKTGIPRAALVNGAMLLANLALIVMFYKELVISAFDPALATTQGVHARVMHYALMAITAATLVAAFESVGSILVIAMLITPAATANLLTDRLAIMIGLSLAAAALSAILGHVAAITLPPVIFSRLGFDTVMDASTSGTMAVASGLLFVLALLFGPRQGVVSKAASRLTLSVNIAAQDLLGVLYRLEERGQTARTTSIRAFAREALGCGPLVIRLAFYWLAHGGRIAIEDGQCRLTSSGRQMAEKLVRSHRLWESYMVKHFEIPEDHLHAAASRVEHYIGPGLRQALEGELDTPERDPHGRTIPREE
jgi:manganese/zinc/iron transport system permease protein